MSEYSPQFFVGEDSDMISPSDLLEKSRVLFRAKAAQYSGHLPIHFSQGEPAKGWPAWVFIRLRSEGPSQTVIWCLVYIEIWFYLAGKIKQVAGKILHFSVFGK